MKNAAFLACLSFFTVTLGAQVPTAREVDSLMALDLGGFDQDMQGGWRYYANQKKFDAAASLIETYLERDPETSDFDRRLLSWHAGQMLAMDGQEEKAIPFMEKSRKGEDDFMLWNPYLDATVAFLKKDRPAFNTNLKAVASMTNNPNLPLLRILEEHFDKSYREALELAMK
jgi:hypothetical protein